MSRLYLAFLPISLLALTGCVSMPKGPSVMVLPGTGMSFEQFNNDNIICQNYASLQVGDTSAEQAAIDSGVTSAVVGTALGAAAGAAFGGGRGAAIGSGGGLLAGSLAGSGAASSSMFENQQRYDSAFIQCMYAKGHQVPVSGQFSYQSSRRSAPPSSQIPPPPGSPVPPPPTR
jgi:hypothetical protein